MLPHRKHQHFFPFYDETPFNLLFCFAQIYDAKSHKSFEDKIVLHCFNVISQKEMKGPQHSTLFAKQHQQELPVEKLQLKL
jgi:hypothetical protein